jgi:transposase
MGATNEFLARKPRSVDGKRNWSTELKAQIVAETFITGEAVNAVAKRYDLKASTVSDWRRMARMGKLDGMEFVPVRIEEAKPSAAVPTLASVSGPLDVINGCVTARLDAGATPEGIAQIAAAL